MRTDQMVSIYLWSSLDGDGDREEIRHFDRHALDLTPTQSEASGGSNVDLLCS